MLARTQEEIIDHYKSIEEEGMDFFGVMRADTIAYLTYENAKPFIKSDVTFDDWPDAVGVDPIDQIKDYMPFALEKAQDHRGLSAGRSIMHMRAWLWLAGDDELLAFADDDRNYPMYGVPILAAICKKYEIETPDEEWFINMSQGNPCSEDCDEC